MPTRSGITGPPGVGKSSLISALVRHVREQERTVGVVSVDPSSPFTQGALLGDRIRLADHFLDPGVFIRSMGTRGHLGGLAEATLQALLVLDASGKDVVFLETVGTGQSEVEVIGIADTVVLVLMPGSGDSVQALKAGIMEIPDVIAINKMDHPAAKTMLNEVRSILSLDRDRAWRPPIVLTDAMRGENVPELWAKIEEHRASPRGGGAARGAPAPEPRPRGLRRRLGPREGASGARGGRRPRAPAAAGRGAAARARSADGGAGDNGEGVPPWRRYGRHPHSLTSRRRDAAARHGRGDADLPLGVVLAALRPRGAAEGGEPPAHRVVQGPRRVQQASRRFGRRAGRRRRRRERGQSRPGGCVGRTRAGDRGDDLRARRTRRWRRSRRLPELRRDDGDDAGSSSRTRSRLRSSTSRKRAGLLSIRSRTSS